MSWDAFEQRLGHVFAQRSLLALALTHPSRSFELRSRDAGDNQRLEFLGDAVLQLAVTEHLYRHQPTAAEGELTARRARLVNRHQLHALAQRLEIESLLVLGRGEEANGGRTRPSNLADAMEAVLGAVYLDAGYPAVQSIIERLLFQSVEAPDAEAKANPKGALQEWLQSNGEPPPVYQLLAEDGPAHARRYRVKVEWNGRELGFGEGSSKKEAEAQAALAALHSLRNQTPPGEPSIKGVSTP